MCKGILQVGGGPARLGVLRSASSLARRRLKDVFEFPNTQFRSSIVCPQRSRKRTRAICASAVKRRSLFDSPDLTRRTFSRKPSFTSSPPDSHSFFSPSTTRHFDSSPASNFQTHSLSRLSTTPPHHHTTHALCTLPLDGHLHCNHCAICAFGSAAPSAFGSPWSILSIALRLSLYAPHHSRA